MTTRHSSLSDDETNPAPVMVLLLPNDQIEIDVHLAKIERQPDDRGSVSIYESEQIQFNRSC